MELSYKIQDGRAVIGKIENPDRVVMVPETLEGCPVTELGAYALAGSGVEELYLPSRLVKIGAYAFYNCHSLRRITCFGRAVDLGAGLFAGVQTVEYLDITLFSGEKSCLKELLSELRQTLRVRIRETEPGSGTAVGGTTEEVTAGTVGETGSRTMAGTTGGAMGRTMAGTPGGTEGKTGGGPTAESREARLIFPEYYEDSVENTPARIVSIETHGCGHRYRYCFQNRVFQYRDYDSIFPHMKVQEPEALAAELAVSRLKYPLGLTEAAAREYRAYLAEHWQAAGQVLIDADRLNRDSVTSLDPGQLPWLVEQVLEPMVGDTPETGWDSILSWYISLAQNAGDPEMVSWLMDYRHRRFGGGRRSGTQSADSPSQPEPRRPRRFQL